MKKMKKSSIVFLSLLLIMVANFSIALASSYDFTLVRAVGAETGITLKNKDADFGFVTVLTSSEPGYTTDYHIIDGYELIAYTDQVRVKNQRYESGRMYYDKPEWLGYVRLRGIDGSLKAPNYTTVTGLWSPMEEMNH